MLTGHSQVRTDSYRLISFDERRLKVWDFLGLVPQDDPTFFFTMVCKPSTNKYFQKVVESEM